MTTYYNYLGQAMAVSANPGPFVTGSSSGHETITAPAGPSGVSTGGGNYDTLIGSDGDNIFYLNNITDVVQVADGLSGVKTIVSYSGGYTLPANVQNLTFYGAGNWGAGNSLDNLIVMGGNDQNYMDGGAGNDVLVGGFGQNNIGFEVGGGHDTIYNFHTNLDTVRIAGASFTSFGQIQSAMRQVGSDVVLTIDGADSITFRGVSVNDFQARDFLMPLDRSQLGALTFSDDFNGLQLWNASTRQGLWQTNFGGDPTKLDTYAITSNDEKQVYTAPNFVGQDGYSLAAYNPFSIDNGVLDITAGKFSYADSQHTWGQAYYSGMLNTRGIYMQKYGYFEMRAELPTALGTWPAFWLSQDPYKPGVEADILEHLAMYPDVNFARVNDAGVVTGNTNFAMPSLSGFHTYGMLWGPTTTTFYIDDLAVMQVATPASWDKPMYMLLDMAVGGWGGPIDANALPAQMKVDYVHVYGLASSAVGVSVGAQTYTAPSGVNSVTLIGTSQTVTANDAGDQLIGTAGADTFILGKGGDTVLGGGGADTFKINAVPWAVSHITDFAAGDSVNLTGLLASLGYGASDPVGAGALKFASAGDGSAQVWVKSGGQWALLTVLDGVSPTGLDAHGGIITWQGASSSTGSLPPTNAQPPSTPAEPPVVSPTFHATAPDFNADGKGDLFWQNAVSGLTSVWTLNDTAASGISLPAAPGWQVQDVGNFTGTSLSGDFLLRNPTTGMVNIWLDKGGGQMAGADAGAATLDWNIMAAADFNGDGKSDILWRNEQNGYVSVWQMDGTQATGSYNPGQVGLNWHIVGAADYTGDGRADILWRNASSGEVNLWQLDSQGQAHGSTIATLSLDWQAAGSGDFNGDGKADILWRNANTGQAVIWEMNGSQVQAWQAIGQPGPQWKIAAVTDMNGDGKSDIIWRDSNTGQVVGWAMNGFNVDHSGVIATVDTSWQLINHHFDWV